MFLLANTDTLPTAIYSTTTAASFPPASNEDLLSLPHLHPYDLLVSYPPIHIAVHIDPFTRIIIISSRIDGTHPPLCTVVCSL